MDKLREALVARINNYFQMGGVFNPEQMDHIKVRDLLKDCREFLAAPAEPPDKRLRELAWELINASELFERTLSQWNTLPRTQLFTATKAMKEALSSTSEPPTHVTFDKPIIGSDGMVQTGWQSAAPSEPQASEPQRTLHIPWINFGRCDCGWSSSIEAKEENYEQWCVHAEAAEPQASEPPELSDKDGWLYDPDAKLAEIRAGMSEPPASELKKLVREYMSVCGYNKFERPEEHWHFKALMSLLEVLESTAFARGRKAGLEEAADALREINNLQHRLAIELDAVPCQPRIEYWTRKIEEVVVRALAGEPASKETK